MKTTKRSPRVSIYELGAEIRDTLNSIQYTLNDILFNQPVRKRRFKLSPERIGQIIGSLIQLAWMVWVTFKLL